MKIFSHFYIAILRPLIDYGNIIYDQPLENSFCEKSESTQYKTASAVLGAIQLTSPEKILQELGLELLKSRRWFRFLCFMFKIMTDEAPNYLISMMQKRN